MPTSVDANDTYWSTFFNMDKLSGSVSISDYDSQSPASEFLSISDDDYEYLSDSENRHIMRKAGGFRNMMSLRSEKKKLSSYDFSHSGNKIRKRSSKTINGGIKSDHSPKRREYESNIKSPSKTYRSVLKQGLSSSNKTRKVHLNNKTNKCSRKEYSLSPKCLDRKIHVMYFEQRNRLEDTKRDRERNTKDIESLSDSFSTNYSIEEDYSSEIDDESSCSDEDNYKRSNAKFSFSSKVGTQNNSSDTTFKNESKKQKNKFRLSAIFKTRKSNYTTFRRSRSQVLARVLSPNHINVSTRAKDDEITNEKVVYYFFGDDPNQSMECVKQNEKLIPEVNSAEVLVKVEASTVSRTDNYLRHNRLGSSQGMLPITPGVDFVGQVVNCGKKASSLYHIHVNDRVAALVQTGGNAKYQLEHANQLVKVPKQVNASKAAILVEIYLSAFQTLLLFVKGSHRYESMPLHGKSILIIKGISTVNQAMIELALILGAEKVYTTAYTKHVDFLRKLGAIVFDISQDDYLSKVKGQMDIVVDSFCDDLYESSFKALNHRGYLICNGMQTLMNMPSREIQSIEQLLIKTKTEYISRIYNYDVYSYWESNLEESKRDLSFLFKLLEKKAINPCIADTVSLKKVAKAHMFLQGKRRIQGSFVCLPHSIIL